MDSHSQQHNGKSHPPRLPLAKRRAEARRAARQRVAARTTAPLTPAQKALDPLRHDSAGASRVGKVFLVLLAALLAHTAIVTIAFLLGAGARPADRLNQDVVIEVREPPPPPPEPEVLPEVEPADVEAPEPPPKAPKPAPKQERLPPAPPPKTPEPPPPPEAKPPPRVVGLSLDSTMEGGNGPSFAVGNTREGRTADRAADPTKVAAVGAGPIVAEPTEAPNRAATRIPTVGLVFTPAKRKQPSNPPFPATLRSQEIEGDVTVMVSIDATGKVTAVKIIKESPHPEFNDIARKFAMTEAYEPAMKNGVPMSTTITFTYKFRLEQP